MHLHHTHFQEAPLDICHVTQATCGRLPGALRVRACPADRRTSMDSTSIKAYGLLLAAIGTGARAGGTLNVQEYGLHQLEHLRLIRWVLGCQLVIRRSDVATRFAQLSASVQVNLRDCLQICACKGRAPFLTVLAGSAESRQVARTPGAQHEARLLPSWWW